SAQVGVEAGLDIAVEDAFGFLKKMGDGSLGAITAFQVVEHWTRARTAAFLHLASRKLAPGGVALFETLNPAVFAAYRWFHLDPTHVSFLAPEALRFACECAGFEHVETNLVHPVSEHERLREAGDDNQRENLRRLNETLYGPQDYYLLARKPLEQTP
ncbi:hypothetical protein HQ520_04225, partial [bacterium]|nr:hypothetical protein [bacterium]